MRKQVLATVIGVTVAASMLAVLDGGAAGAAVAAKPTPITAACNAKIAVKGITAAFNQFLAATTAPDRVKLVDQGAKIQDALDKSNQVTVASGRPRGPLQDVAANLEVTCTAKTKATFTFDLQIKQASTGATTPPLGLHQPGAAVLKKGTWYLTALTACAFAALNPDPANQAPVTECYQALGRPVPVPTT